MPYRQEGERLVFDARTPVDPDPNVIAAPIAPTLLRLGHAWGRFLVVGSYARCMS
jgi:hypothetical protein